MRVNGLIPARFLVLISHIIITVTIFISRDLHIKASLSTTYTTAEYNAEDLKFIIVLAVSCFLFAFEMLSFLFGVTMFLPTQSLFSIMIHCGGTVSSCYFVMWAWSYSRFWPIFAVTIALPALLDLTTASHFAGSVALLLFLLDSWPVNDFFYIFGFCIAFPAVTEVIAIISAFSYTPKSAEAPARSAKPAGQRGGAKAS